MHLANYAYRGSSSLIDWNDRFHAELHVLARPDHAGINGARGLTALSAVQRRLKGKFHERNKSVERSTQSDVLYLFLQIDERVLQRETILQHVWNAAQFHPRYCACWRWLEWQRRPGRSRQRVAAERECPANRPSLCQRKMRVSKY